MKRYEEEDTLYRMDMIEEAMDRLLAARIALFRLGEGWEEGTDALRDTLDDLEREREICIEEIRSQGGYEDIWSEAEL